MNDYLKKSYAQGRKVAVSQRDDERLGKLRRLPGTWVNAKKGKVTGFEGRGWNMIALPFEEPGGNLDYRMLVNQYNEVIEFEQIDGPVPNRGIDRQANVNTDQALFALDYQQAIVQIAVSDHPETDESTRGPEGGAIHHEPGFFLSIVDRRTDDLDIARLATIPHGNSVLAMGRSRVFSGKPTVEEVNGLPIGATQDLNSPYLVPYVAFSGPNAFKGKVPPPFPGFDVVEPSSLLQLGIDGLDVKETTELKFDTKLQTGGIVNTPFVVKQADATEMTATFYIMELNDVDEATGESKFALAYIQVVLLEFFERFDNQPGLIKWPHVSINTLVFDAPREEMALQMPSY